jgi:4-amino-4-deoxy-L-arabinose transferase-like glycosyltransferase
MLRRRSLIVFCAAWAIRLVHVVQIRRVPYFDVPLIDGANYFRTAALIASGDLRGGPGVFWQPPLYPYFLAAFLATIGRRLEVLYAIQSALGAFSCLMVYWIGRRVFGERAGLAAACVMALYGPLIYFDAQPLIPVLHIALVLAGLLLLLRAAARPGAGGDAARGPERAWGAAGIAWGLAAIATPNVLAAAPAAALWAGRRMRSWRRPVSLFLAGLAAPVALVAIRNAVVAGDFVPISSNAGINFYIGNNADYERTIRIRPGGEFERLAQEPENLGIRSASARSRYFMRRAFDFLLGYPGAALRLYARKTVDLIAGREIPRNQDMYALRAYSSLLALLLWRWGVSCPFGLVAPLALAGALLPGDAVPGEGAAGAASRGAAGGRALLLGFAASYAASVVLFFPTDRYRLPLVPVAALLAGRALGAGRLVIGRPRVMATLCAGLVLFNLDALRRSDAYPEEEALNRAYALRAHGRLAEARAEYRRAIAINPDRIDSYNSLAAMAAQEGEWEEAAGLYREILARAPDFAAVREALGQAYLALGRKDDARREWQLAAGLAPGAGAVLADLCLSFRDEGAYEAARGYCEQGVRVRPDLPDTHFAMGLLWRALREPARAKQELLEAARLFPPDSPGRGRAETILRKMKEKEASAGNGGRGA